MATDASVVANGNVALTWAGSTFEGAVDVHDELESFQSDIGLRGSVTLELAAETAGDLGGPWSWPPWASPRSRSAQRFPRPMPQPACARPRHRCSFRRLGCRTNALSFDATVEVELTTTFLVSISGIPYGGPVLAASLGIELDVDLQDQPWWTLDGLAGLKYGWSMPDLLGAPNRRGGCRHSCPTAAGTSPRPKRTPWSRCVDPLVAGVRHLNQDHAGAVQPVGDEFVVVENDSSPWMTTLDAAGNPTWQQTDDPASGSQGRQACAH